MDAVASVGILPRFANPHVTPPLLLFIFRICVLEIFLEPDELWVTRTLSDKESSWNNRKDVFLKPE